MFQQLRGQASESELVVELSVASRKLWIKTEQKTQAQHKKKKKMETHSGAKDEHACEMRKRKEKMVNPTVARASSKQIFRCHFHSFNAEDSFRPPASPVHRLHRIYYRSHYPAQYLQQFWMRVPQEKKLCSRERCSGGIVKSAHVKTKTDTYTRD